MIKFCNYLGGKSSKLTLIHPFHKNITQIKQQKKKLTNKTNRRKNSNKQHTDIEI